MSLVPTCMCFNYIPIYQNGLKKVKKMIVTLIFLRQFLQCMKRPAQNNVSSKLFPLLLFAFILLSPRILLCN